MNGGRRVFVALVAGALFGVGLGIAGMTKAPKIIAFLDVTGAWDPSLAFVMIGAIGVHFLAVRLARRRGAPIYAAAFDWPRRGDIDGALVGGSAIFGIGWGLGGFCPGPALVGAASGSGSALAFSAAMVLGMFVRQATSRR